MHQFAVSNPNRSAPKSSIAIIGFGYVGTVLGVFLAEKGFRVIAIESQETVVRSILSGKLHLKEPSVNETLTRFIQDRKIALTTSYAEIQNVDVVIVTVGTPLGGNYSADLSSLTSCLRSIRGYLRPGQLIILKSTIPPGTTREVVAPILEQAGLKAGEEILLAFCPERLAEGSAMAEIRKLPVVVGGFNEKSAYEADSFWKAAGLQTIRVKSPEAAELTKLADNLWIDVNVALANELARVCESIGVDAMDVIQAANSLPKGRGQVNYLIPGIGVGGSCLTKDPWFFVDYAKSHEVNVAMPQVARRVNDGVPSSIVHLVSKRLVQNQNDPSELKIAILGYAFKGSTSDARNTPARHIISGLAAKGFQISVFDPWVNVAVIESETSLRPSSSLSEALRNADAVLVLADHPEFKPFEQISSELKRGVIIYDAFHAYDMNHVQHLGFEYYSPGAFGRKVA